MQDSEAQPDYQKIAGDVLFGGETLDNSVRGIFIEAVVMDALARHDRANGLGTRWRHVGLGWGPWDLQRGTGEGNDRVRFQVKAKASRQLWKPQRERPYEYDLGWKDAETLPAYFERDFPTTVFGDCEPAGHRCDFFLLAWHGPNPVTGQMSRREQQSNPGNYDYFIVPCSSLGPNAGSVVKKLPARQLFERFEAISFGELPARLNLAADSFVNPRAGSSPAVRTTTNSTT